MRRPFDVRACRWRLVRVCLIVFVLASVPVAQATVALFELPADVTTRVTANDATLVYAARRNNLFGLYARPVGSGAGASDRTIMTAPAGFVAFSPAFAPDGRRLYFESNARLPALPGREDTGVWFVELEPGGWSAPRLLGGHFDSPYNEHSPTVDRTGRLCFNSGRPDSQENDIYCGPLDGSSAPLRIAALNSAAEDAAPWLSSSGDVLLFASNRTGGAGGWDLYISRHVQGEWQAPQNLGSPINTADDETAVSLSASDDRLYFARTSIAPPRTRRVYSAPFTLP